MAKKKAARKKRSQSKNAKQLPIDWQDDTRGVFANHLLIQKDEHECHLSFYEVRPPLVFSEEQVSAINTVPATCVARVVVANGRMPSFVKALQQFADDTSTDESGK